MPDEPVWGDMSLSELHDAVSTMHQSVLRSVPREAAWSNLATILRPLYTALLGNSPVAASQHIDTVAQAVARFAPYSTEARAILLHLPTLKLMVLTQPLQLSPETQRKAVEIIRGDMDVIAGRIARIRHERDMLVGGWLPRAERALAVKTGMMLRHRERRRVTSAVTESELVERLRRLL